MAALLSAGPPAPPPLRPFQPPHPQAQAQAQAPERAGERVQVSLAQVPRWQGSEATHNRRDVTSLSPDRMSVPDTEARLATPGDEVIVPADAGQLACLAAIDDADYII